MREHLMERFLFAILYPNLGYPSAMQIPTNAMGNDQATPPVPQTLQSPMANLMSITETLPPGSPRNGPSPPGPPPPRTASRGSQHSPNSSGKIIMGGRGGGFGGGRRHYRLSAMNQIINTKSSHCSFLQFEQNK